jgi:mannosyltransferase
VIVLAAALRFPTLNLQSYWDDEGYTVGLLRMTLDGMLTAIPKSESTPPPYYVIAWFWTHAFGNSEWGLRSLSAIFGVALVPVVYGIARDLSSRRAGLIAALLVAVNPLLIWYSQEARVYALLALVGGFSFFAFIRALNVGGTRLIFIWCVVSALALCTHYFSVFLVVPEALVLLARRRDRPTIVSVAFLAAVGLALASLALEQRSRAYGFREVALSTRIPQIPEQFLVGYGIWSTNLGKLAALVAAALCAYGLLALRKSRPPGFVAGVAVVVAAVLLPIALAGVGLDYVLTLYFIAVLGPALALVAVGLSRARGGIAAALALATLGVCILGVVETHPQFQREDLRGAARAIDKTDLAKVVVVSPPSQLSAYLPELRNLPGGGVDVREVVLLAMAEKDPGHASIVPRSYSRHLSVPGFRLIDVIEAKRFTLVRFRSETPRHVTPQAIVKNRIRGGHIPRTAVLFDDLDD